MKDYLFVIFGSITVLFFLLLIIKAIGKWKFCVLCGSVSLTWIILLALYWAGVFHDAFIITLLVGSSVTGIYYLAEKKTVEKYHLFRLPFFLTLVFIGYTLVTNIPLKQSLPSVVFIAFLWVFFSLLYIYRTNPKFNKAISAVINCCKDW